MSADLRAKGLTNLNFPVNATCPAYQSSVNADSKLGLIIIQEWWGLNVSITKTADEFAALGYRTIVPDLYRGKVATSNEEANHFMGNLNWAQAIEDIRGATKFLKSAGCTKVAVAGFCMGGALAIASSFQIPELDAIVPFYGIPDINNIKYDNIKAPMLAFFGEKDDHKGFSDVETAKKFEAKLKEHNVNAEFVYYSEVGHAFMNKDRPEVYNADVAAKSIAKVGEFLKKVLA